MPLFRLRSAPPVFLAVLALPTITNIEVEMSE